MSEEIKSIHEIDLNIICEYYSTLERQGPGSPEITLKALSFIEGLSENPVIADIGCGTGGQTMVLAQHLPGQISGLDTFKKFIDLFDANARKLNLQDRVKGIVGTMEEMPYEHGELDLIWSEGSIYNIGFERGLQEWRTYLKEGGFVAISEACWFTEERPDEINEFWQDAYPGIDTVSTKLDQLQKAGYLPIASFMLPENCWTKHFYEPQVSAHENFLQKHKGNKGAEDFIANQQHEIDLYYKYKEYYGYAFFIGKKI